MRSVFLRYANAERNLPFLHKQVRNICVMHAVYVIYVVMCEDSQNTLDQLAINVPSIKAGKVIICHCLAFIIILQSITTTIVTISTFVTPQKHCDIYD